MPIWKSALLWNDTQFLDKKLEYFGFNATEPYNATYWPHIPCCHDKCNPWHPHKGASWKQCMYASPMAINVAGYKLVYSSYNGTSETNIMGYWTTSLVGPDGGTIQSDIWKLGAATANINLTSHSGSSVIKGLKACVQHPFALLAGPINISKNGIIFDNSCSNCNLTSCVDNYMNDSLLIVKQSPYVLVPTNFMGPWYHDRGL
jgi:hypothetical protein